MHLRLMGGGEFIWIEFIDMKKAIETNSIEMALLEPMWLLYVDSFSGISSFSIGIFM